MAIIKLKTEIYGQTVRKQETSPQSYKTQINILPFPGLAQSGTEQPGQGATPLGWPKSIYYRLKRSLSFFIQEQTSSRFGTELKKHLYDFFLFSDLFI